MAKRAQIKGAPEDASAKLKRWLKSEYYDQEKFSSNLGVAKAVGLFFGSTLVFAYFGEAFNV
jgi:hypothetical protein